MSGNKFLKDIRESAGIRLAVLFGSFFILLTLSSIISVFVDKAPGGLRAHALISAAISALIVFCLPAFILGKFSSNHSLEWLELTRAPKIRALFGVVIIYLISMPAMEWLIEWNSSLHLPQSLASLENLLRQWESSSEESTKLLLDAHGWLPVLTGVIVIGVLTGFAEELFFRGGLQGTLVRASIGKHVAVWTAAFIFSTMHFQFFGFVPRLIMGAFFGYLLIWTRSIWVPVFAHVLNNSAVVVTSALTGDISTSLIDETNVTLYLGNSLTVLSSVILTALFLILCRRTLFTSKLIHKKWQRSQLPPVSGR